MKSEGILFGQHTNIQFEFEFLLIEEAFSTLPTLAIFLCLAFPLTHITCQTPVGIAFVTSEVDIPSSILNLSISGVAEGEWKILLNVRERLLNNKHCLQMKTFQT